MPIRAFIIRPKSHEVEPVELAPDPGADTRLIALRRTLDCRCVDRVPFEPEPVDAWLDGEHLVSRAARNRLATDVLRAYGADYFGDAVRGAVIFAAHDDAGRMRAMTEREQAVFRNAVRQARVM